MSFTIFVENLKQLSEVAKQLLKQFSNQKKFVFYGDIGVGITTLIKELSLQLGVNDVVSSPTFSIVNEYITDCNTKIYHFDFYRIEDEKEAYDIGFEEYFYSDSYCFIEWPEKIPNLITDNVVKVRILLEGNKRIINVII